MKNGEKVSEVSYFDVDVWGITAENCSKYLTKGNGIIVEGRLRQDRWEKDGKTHSRVRITANAVHFLPKKQNNSSAGEAVSTFVDKPAGSQSASVGQPEDITWEE